jgi:hypothetical protein
MTIAPRTVAAFRTAIDLNLTLWSRTKGDITVYGTWIMTTGRPCLVLLRTDWKPGAQAIPCIVPLDQAWLWDENTGDPVHAAHTTVQFAHALGLNVLNPREMIRLTSIIREHLGDLLRMPPLPDTEAEVVADAIVTNRVTGKTIEAEIKDHV